MDILCLLKQALLALVLVQLLLLLEKAFNIVSLLQIVHSHCTEFWLQRILLNRLSLLLRQSQLLLGLNCMARTEQCVFIFILFDRGRIIPVFVLFGLNQL